MEPSAKKQSEQSDLNYITNRTGNRNTMTNDHKIYMKKKMYDVLAQSRSKNKPIFSKTCYVERYFLCDKGHFAIESQKTTERIYICNSCKSIVHKIMNRI